MLKRPKAGSINRLHGKSINDRVCKDQYMGTLLKLKLRMVDDITARITFLNGNCLLYKIDIQRAFRQLKLDPKNINRTGLQHNDQYDINIAVPFGYKHGSVGMQRVMSLIV